MYEAFVNPFRCRTPASFQIAVLLDDDRSARKAVGQRRDVLGKLIGVGERFGKLVGDKEGEVRVLTAELRVRIGVAVGQDDAVVILDDDVTARIGAESPDNGPLAGRIEEFAFVEITVNILHDDVRGLDTDADVHSVVHEVDPIFFSVFIRKVEPSLPTAMTRSWQVIFFPSSRTTPFALPSSTRMSSTLVQKRKPTPQERR